MESMDLTQRLNLIACRAWMPPILLMPHPTKVGLPSWTVLKALIDNASTQTYLLSNTRTWIRDKNDMALYLSAGTPTRTV